jgi:hypothetical protein
MNPPPLPTVQAQRGWANPIFRRYCRSRLRPSGLGITLLISLLLAGFIFALTGSISTHFSKLDVVDTARGAIIPLLILQALILFGLGTAQVSGGMTAEADEGVLDYQRLIPMSPLAKVLGYLFGLPVREYAMVLVTLPFTAWSLWKGQVSFFTWAPLYAIFFTTTITYHLTGLVTGTVVKNRRWAFLISIVLVFSLYTVIPQIARFGLVFFKYLTIIPVFQESLPGLIPKTAGAIVATGQRLAPEAKFFGLAFPEVVFTLFCQGGLVLIFLVMLCRKWRRSESLLLGKIGATSFFIWVQLLLLGNALPLIESGNLFPSSELSRRMLDRVGWSPSAFEAVGMSGLYGIVTLLFLYLITKIITPTPDIQIRGWRRTRKEGRHSLPLLSDAATAFPWIAIIAMVGAVSWFIFTKSLVESRWFPGHEVPLSVLGFYGALMLSAGLGFHALLEAKSGRTLFLTAIFVGIVPLMIGSVVATAGAHQVAAWIIAISPLSAPIYANATLLSLTELPEDFIFAIPRAFYFWQAISALVTVWLIVRLHATRRALAQSSDR